MLLVIIDVLLATAFVTGMVLACRWLMRTEKELEDDEREEWRWNYGKGPDDD